MEFVNFAPFSIVCKKYGKIRHVLIFTATFVLGKKIGKSRKIRIAGQPAGSDLAPNMTMYMHLVATSCNWIYV